MYDMMYVSRTRINQLVVAMNRSRYFFLPMVLAILLAGCTGGSGETLKIDMQHLVGRQNMPDELTYMLRGLGYDWIPLADPNSHGGVRVIQHYNEYRMLFGHTEAKQVRIDVHIGLQNNATRLRFYEIGSSILSPSAKDLLQKLRERTAAVFGSSNIAH